MRSLGIESMLRLEDLDLVPEQFQNRSVESQAKYRLIATYQQSAYCRVFCKSFLSVYVYFYYPQRKIYTHVIYKTCFCTWHWFIILLRSLHFIFSIEKIFRFGDVLVGLDPPCLSPSSLPPSLPPRISVVVTELVLFWGMWKWSLKSSKEVMLKSKVELQDGRLKDLKSFPLKAFKVRFVTAFLYLSHFLFFGLKCLKRPIPKEYPRTSLIFWSLSQCQVSFSGQTS